MFIEKNFLIITIIIVSIGLLFSEENIAFDFLSINYNPLNSSLNYSNYTYTERNGNILGNPALIPKKSFNYFNINSGILFEDYEFYGVHYSYPLKHGFLTAGFLANNILKDNVLLTDNNQNNVLYYLSFGGKVYENLQTGLTVKYVEEKTESYKLNKVLFDVGILYELVEEVSNLSIVFKNIGSSFNKNEKKYEIPVLHSFGFNFVAYDENDIKINFLSSYVKINNEKDFFNSGIIISYKDFSLFSGYSTREILRDKFNYGLSFQYGNVNLSLSQSKYGNKGDYFTLNVSFQFGEQVRQKVPKLYRIKKSDLIRCLNCSYEYSNEFNYCSKCGQPAATIIR